MNDPLSPGATPLQFAGFTRLSKLLVGLLFSTYALSWVSPTLISYLALIPGKTLPCVWNVVTAGLVETNFWMLLFDATTLLLMAGHLEPNWGSKEFLKFVTVINTTVGVAAFVIMLSLYFCTGSEYYLYGQLHGFHGVIGALFVALKRSIPEYEVKLFVCISLKVKYLPLLLVFIATVISEVIMDDDLVMFTLLGTYSGWVYLRYYQHNALTGTKGDLSEAMIFFKLLSSCLQARILCLSAYPPAHPPALPTCLLPSELPARLSLPAKLPARLPTASLNCLPACLLPSELPARLPTASELPARLPTAF
ncbi:hypothetical protein CYMTET_23062 [Cymbomonas tetramitiformis]|uniref:Transmembrane protein 115 n=1 Tax=Cymbomonas tetramitiformis TaxID=36881 RepID=A0AAE0L1H6_9CHLO|nr:hypothetical protein CYMTET_23062 [Cymbomonas tetramitiformis]